MASPPFSLNTAVPGNSDIAAQFPALDRSDKDVIQSWITTQQNTYGINKFLLLVGVGVSGNPTYGTGLANAAQASTSPGAVSVYYDTDFTLKQFAGDINNTEYVGNPPGTIIMFGSTTAPAGYVYCDGSPLSRTTFARLFHVIGTSYGAGDGSTTFNVPDLRARLPVGADPSGTGRITIGPVSVGNTAGAQTQTITQAQLPNVALTLVGTTVDLSSIISGGFNLYQVGSGSFNVPNVAGNAIRTNVPFNYTPAGTVLLNGGVTQQALATLPPYQVVAYHIKF